jgi:hypothetical protein
LLYQWTPQGSKDPSNGGVKVPAWVAEYRLPVVSSDELEAVAAKHTVDRWPQLYAIEASDVSGESTWVSTVEWPRGEMHSAFLLKSVIPTMMGNESRPRVRDTIAPGNWGVPMNVSQVAVDRVMERYLCEHDERTTIKAFLIKEPSCVAVLESLPEKIGRLWGEGTKRSLRLSVEVDPEDGSEQLVVSFRGFNDPTRDCELLDRLDEEQIHEEWPSGSKVIVLPEYSDDD